jgi:hypothetical protein
MADRTPTVASGARSTVAGIVSTRLKVDMSDTLFRLESEEGALMTTMSLCGKERANAKTVEWLTSELRPKFARINGGISNGLTDTTFTVDSPQGSYVQSGFLIKFTRTGETCLTTTGGSATTIVVTTRSWGATAAGTVVDNDEILIIGPAYAENASLQSAISVTETRYTNNVHTMRHNWAMSGLLQEISNNGGTYAEKDPETQRQDMLLVHKRDLNLALLHSEGATSGGTATVQGLVPWIVANAPNNQNAATVLTEPVFEAGNRTWTRFAKSKRLTLIASREFCGIVDQFARVVQRVEPGADTYGLAITTYRSRYCTIKLIEEIGLEGDEYSKYAIGVDPKNLRLKYVRDTRMLKNRQGTSVDGTEEEVLTDFSGVYGLPESTYLWTDAAS